DGIRDKLVTGVQTCALPIWGNVDGESNDYDGSKLANGDRYGGSDTVVVTINYRLGLLGFLANPALDREGHAFGNYGTMDIQAARSEERRVGKEWRSRGGAGE